MTDQTTSPVDPIGFVERVRDKSTRTLSEEFHTRSPNTQLHIKDMTGGITPTSHSNKRMTAIRGSSDIVDRADVETSEERFNMASSYEKEMMFRHGLIPPNCKAYRDYAQKHMKTT